MRQSDKEDATKFLPDMLRNPPGPSLEQRVMGPVRLPDVTSDPIGEPNLNIGGLNDLCRDYFATIGYVVSYLVKENLFIDLSCIIAEHRETWKVLRFVGPASNSV